VEWASVSGQLESVCSMAEDWRSARAVRPHSSSWIDRHQPPAESHDADDRTGVMRFASVVAPKLISKQRPSPSFLFHLASVL
jgi:hypothetical protein